MKSMPSLKLTTLGGLSAETSAGEQIVFPTRKAAALLAYLAVEGDRRHSREELVALLWPEADETHGRANLRQTLARLRRALPGAVSGSLETGGQSLAFADGVLDCDLTRFGAALAQGEPATLEEAAALYYGPFLAGLSVGSVAFSDWADEHRRRAEEQIQEALRRLLDHYVTAGRIELAVASAQRLLAFDPLQEAVQRSLIGLYTYQERYGAALAQYQRCREVLQRELGVEPDEETEALHQQILQQAPKEGAAEDLPAPAIRPAAAPSAKAVGSERPSIAVLPFADLSPGGEAAHLAIGLTEEVITALTRFRELQVIATHSAFAYQSAGLPPGRAAALLGVRYRLEGGLQLAGNRLRLTARLIEAESGRHLWAERFERGRGGLFELQDELTRRIVASLVERIEGERLEHLRAKPPADWQAEDFWLKGRAALRRIDFRSVARARHYFRRALELEPDFAPAHAGLAMTEMRRWSYFNWQPRVALSRDAYRHARRAVELDGADHRTQCILGFTYLMRRNFEGARRHLDRALELNPNDAQTLAHLCVAQALLGEPALGIEAGELALRLDPYHPDWYVGSLGSARFIARQYEAAIDALASVPEAFCDTPAYLAAALAYCDRSREAAPWRELVHRQYEQRRARGEFAGGGCVDWLISVNPFRLDSDSEHFQVGLRKAGF
jgi:DNA-binding SARP family transcriptional activator/cytochrome c-type biogenesis protein CcmH/NrfG